MSAVILNFGPDQAKTLRKKLAEFSKLDADRIALGRLQNAAFGATSRPAMTAPQPPSVVTSAPNPTDQEPTRA